MSDQCRQSGVEGLTGGKSSGKPGSKMPEVSIGIGSGEAKVGNMGCEGMKKYSHMSVVLTFTYALERRNAALRAGCLIDKPVAQDVENNFTLREAGTMQLSKRSNGKPMEVHQLVGKKAASEDEWMYQLEEQNSHKDEFFFWKEAVKAIKDQDWAAAEQSLKATGSATADADANLGSQRKSAIVAALQQSI